MKNLFTVSLLFLLISCVNNDQNKLTKSEIIIDKLVENVSKIDLKACDLLSKELIIDLFPTATDFNTKPSHSSYPTCRYEFKANGEIKNASLTIAKGFGSQKNFDKAMTYLSEKEILNGLGQKAYYIPKLNQVSTWEGKNIIHVNIDNNKEKTIKAVRIILKKLK